MGQTAQLRVEVTLQTEGIEHLISHMIHSQIHSQIHAQIEDSPKPEGQGIKPQDELSDRPSASAIAPELLLTETLWSALFQQWLAELNPQLSPIASYELSLRLTDDDDIQSLNRDYRHINRPTDVLAFSALDEVTAVADSVYSVMPFYLGDIVISVETAHHQAQHQGHSLTTELLWLATHGLLHLLGWDHPDDDRLEEMLNQQQRLIHALES